MLLILIAIDILGSLLGIFASSTERMRSEVVAISGGILCGVALVWMLPEMSQISGWNYAGLALVGCLGMLFLREQHVHPRLVRRLMVISMRAAGADRKYKPVHQSSVVPGFSGIRGSRISIRWHSYV
jgi:hypothetical protein